ncbi:EscE/YscE/SsaE family type III secretion system needle protein co-chaperone [Trinickia caryophylli]|uniref:Type III secretion system, E component of needle n=1 Tax=Trinickia caryophylli TaxID=28094 RepID=A0A1X7EW83_TRICW|nr:EscE/YscE/SsaE family type III secretion system needle protein co-chaperone [Trinickia caryophylli]PMS09690.1 hypothetical protein C0Z17_23725 [Trinickia caryophylli]TRX18461.1 hypothetical protein FNF07_09685 [Trinickia caryophylli]WQE10754.1 EscE/YscE/SsaE family type III secretion system needle protein co-chaperone [Trinickia caryophylli]SMF41479.1 Type III secretion system, E component of needle [Trinickia caryophylli]GLU33129.1 hypothetical protein Busp01_29710 [Trinickia caryophylli]
MARITYLEEMLGRDPARRACGEMVKRLTDQEAALRTALRTPRGAREHAALLRCERACASARIVVETLWARYHGGEDIE